MGAGPASRCGHRHRPLKWPIGVSHVCRKKAEVKDPYAVRLHPEFPPREREMAGALLA